ncbi:MAG: glycosyltransferase family 39 protein, partial [Actinomycetes bacterium]
AASTVLLATIGAYKTGRLPWLIAAGAAAGFAAGSKYTGGYLILCPILILIVNRRTLGKKAFLWLGLTLAAAAVVFAITTPYALMHPQVFLHELRTLNEINGRHWVGEAEQSATTYYLWTLTWAFGWLPLATSLVGAVLLIRRERNLAIVLLIPGVALWFLCALKATYFARFLLPGYPMLMLLSGLGCAFLARAAASKLPFVRVPLVAGVI